MPVGLRKRRSDDHSLHRVGDIINDRRPKHEPPPQPIFSDNEDGDDDNESQPTIGKASLSTITMGASTMPEVVKAQPTGVTFRNENPAASHMSSVFHVTSNQSEGTADDIEEDLEMFSKDVQISNMDQIDHANLMRIMHERFKKKAEKWEKHAAFYSKCTFGLNFFILVMQILQILLHQLTDIFSFTTRHTAATTSDTKNYLPRVGLYRRYMRQTSQNETMSIESDPLSSTQVFQCILAALTALVAGLQLKLKLTEKSERYRRGAKMYGRLLRMSTYYLMLLESGGKIDNVVALWREAMRKEGKWIPLVKTFMTL